jgi:ribosomal protein S14
MKNRQANVVNEIKKLALQTLWKDHKLTGNKRFDNDCKMRLHQRMWELDKRAATPKLKNYCHYIGHSRSVNRKLFMSRHMFRKFARFGMLPGFIKDRC